MGPNTCYLITLCNGDYLLRVALKAEREVEYFMEPDGQAELERQLPRHCQGFGKIVQVEELHEVVVKPEATQ